MTPRFDALLQPGRCSSTLHVLQPHARLIAREGALEHDRDHCHSIECKGGCSCKGLPLPPGNPSRPARSKRSRQPGPRPCRTRPHAFRHAAYPANRAPSCPRKVAAMHAPGTLSAAPPPSARTDHHPADRASLRRSHVRPFGPRDRVHPGLCANQKTRWRQRWKKRRRSYRWAGPTPRRSSRATRPSCHANRALIALIGRRPAQERDDGNDAGDRVDERHLA